MRCCIAVARQRRCRKQHETYGSAWRECCVVDGDLLFIHGGRLVETAVHVGYAQLEQRGQASHEVVRCGAWLPDVVPRIFLASLPLRPPQQLVLQPPFFHLTM